MACSLLLTDGSYLLQTDGASHLLLAVCVETPAPETGGGGGGTVQRFPRKWWDSHKEPKRKRKRVIQYAERVSEAFAKASAKDAERLAERAEALQALISQSSFNLAYLEATAERLRKAAVEAAKAETERLQQEQIAVAAEIARLLEDELRDEEEAEFLLLMT
jgi:hypothetical protein